MNEQPVNESEQKPSFERSLSELEQIVADLENGSLGLEESLQRFEVGTKLLRECYSILESAEQKVEQLMRIARDGTVETKPFDATSTLDAQQPNDPKPGRDKPVTRKKPPHAGDDESSADDGVLF